MATHKSAQKRAKQNVKRQARNLEIRSQVKTSIRTAHQMIQDSKTIDEALKAVALGDKALQKAVSKGVYPKQRASRKTSRLAAFMNKKFGATSSATK